MINITSNSIDTYFVLSKQVKFNQAYLKTYELTQAVPVISIISTYNCGGEMAIRMLS